MTELEKVIKEYEHYRSDKVTCTDFLYKNSVPVVRCKDCKYGKYEQWDNGECVDITVYCDEYGIHKPDWFCADGKRKEGR